MLSVKGKSGVFIDGSNMFWAQKDAGWFLDYDKLKMHLRKAHSPSLFNFYGCVDINPGNRGYSEKAQRQLAFYKKLDGMGYKVATKPLKYMASGTKCDMDVDLVVSVYEYIDDLDTIILFSGDSDYLSAITKFHSLGKQIIIYSFAEYLAWELKDFAIKNPRCRYVELDSLRNELELPKSP